MVDRTPADMTNIVFSMLKLLNRYDWETTEPPINRLAIVTGALSFLIFLAFLQELNKAVGMSIVGLATITGIMLLRRKMKTNN